jgi:hypothetical protein
LEKFAAANITTGDSVNFAKGMFNSFSEALEKSKPEKKVKEITDYAKELQKELALVAYENSIMRDGWDYSEAQRNIDLLSANLQKMHAEMVRIKAVQIDELNAGLINPQTTADLTAATSQVDLLQSQLSVLEAHQYIVDNLGNAFSKLGGAIGGTAGEWLSWFGNMVETVPEILKFINAIAVATGMQTAKTVTQTVATDTQTGSNVALAISNKAAAATSAIQAGAANALAIALMHVAIAAALASTAWMLFPANIYAMEAATDALIGIYAKTVAAVTKISGIAKLKSGGVVPPGYPNDSYPAMLTSGEMITPPGKLPKQELSAATIELKGEFKVRGNDLVYILDKQTMKNNLI